MRVATKAIFPNDTPGLRSSALYFFLAAGLISASGLVAHQWILPRLGVRKPQDGMARNLELSYRQPASEHESLLSRKVPSLPSTSIVPILHQHARVGNRPQRQQGVFVIDGDEDDETALLACVRDLHGAPVEAPAKTRVTQVR